MEMFPIILLTVSLQYVQVKSQDAIDAIPTAKLTLVSEWSEVYQSEKVSLQCEIQGSSEAWSYKWYKNGATLQESKPQFNIQSTTKIDSGDYSCQGSLQGRVTTEHSTVVTLTVKAIPTAKLTLVSKWSEVYQSEKVSLQCEIQGSSEAWTYKWYKNRGSLQESESQFNIQSATKIDSGDYTCQGSLQDRVDAELSTALTVTVHARPPAVLTLETEWGDILAGNILTLKCKITDKREWNYTWYENGQELNESLEIYKVTATEETIKSEFKCKGIRTERPLYSALSEEFMANNIVLKRKILLAISGCLVCCIIILIIGCFILKFTRKSEKKDTYRVTEDLFFSVADSKNQTAAPLKEYMENKPTDSEMKECDEKEELFSNCISAVHVDGVIKGP
ncbi:putative high affinity immunoglobulin gamma Fc receptor IB [Myxocyprinus asiaticus]|uniref:putative high affinity immunoglobulin gamma Fc receptor IB n=1 Tax=Myxocyprinus asiaticus TaxID=70543 RepID=UPI0022227640|nr:putative high affinity immunoglobulin gamma Fc receptor IB [Myxocyprinus asiaticus]